MQSELELIQHRLALAQTEIKTLRDILQQVPHGIMDHTDFCRMENDGISPLSNESCHCHVGLIRQALKK